MPTQSWGKTTTPANISESEVPAYAACLRWNCEGHEQHEVTARKTLVEHSFISRGGDLPGIENSYEYLDFTDDKDRTCKVCGRSNGLSEQVRPEYQGLSGHDPLGLVNGTVAKFDPNKRNDANDERVAALE